MTPYYQDDHVTLYHGDCRDVLPTMPLVDVVVTSPPYNMGVTPGGNGRGMYRHSTQVASRFSAGAYGTHDDAMPMGDYEAWQRECLSLMWDRTRLAIFYNHRPRIIHGLWTMPLAGDYGSLPLRQVVTWERPTGIDVGLTHYCTRAEWVMVFARPEWRLVDHSASGMGNVWSIAPEQSEHPAPFPIGLPIRCISSTADVDTVLDPFAGSGTTLRAAKDLGRKAIGIEIEERFCEITARRCAQEVLAL